MLEIPGTGGPEHFPILYGYGKPRNASTQAAICVKSKSGLMLTLPKASVPANKILALTGPSGELRNLLTIAAISPTSGCVVRLGGLYGDSTSPQRAVRTKSGADTAVQSSSTPIQLAGRFSTS